MHNTPPTTKASGAPWAFYEDAAFVKVLMVLVGVGLLVVAQWIASYFDEKKK